MTTFRRIVAGTLVVLAVCAVLIAAPVVLLSRFRGPYVDTVASAVATVRAPKVLLIGDSLTAGGSPWGWTLTGNPLGAVTLARGGFMSFQMEPWSHRESWGFRPRFISIMSGTNDVGSGRLTERQAVRDQLANLDRLLQSGARVIVTLAPPTADPVRSAATRSMDNALRAALASRHVRIIDLWPALAPRGTILPRFTTDGVHFTPAAYRIWANSVRSEMAG